MKKEKVEIEVRFNDKTLCLDKAVPVQGKALKHFACLTLEHLRFEKATDAKLEVWVREGK